MWRLIEPVAPPLLRLRDASECKRLGEDDSEMIAERPTRRERWLWWSVQRLPAVALGVIVLAAQVTVGTTQAEEPVNPSATHPEVPKILWFSVSGLDEANNELDAILATSGRSCIHDRRYDFYKPGECPVEQGLTDFLRKLPPDQPEIARKLQSLGAACRKVRDRLACIYRARENYKALEGAVLLLDEDYSFTVQFNVVNRNRKLEYSTNVERRVTVLYEKKDRFPEHPVKER
jgi:hypothetical protein